MTGVRTDYASKSGGYDGKTGSGENTGKAAESTNKETKAASDTAKNEKTPVASKAKTSSEK